MTLNALGLEATETKMANGWPVLVRGDLDRPKQYGTDLPAALAHVHSELGEMYNAWRDGDRAGFSEELADAIILLVGMADGLGIDLDAAVAAKMATNRTRGGAR
jgi:NTP pyrophosphatase (non-canonical NTP hydrolase)